MKLSDIKGERTIDVIAEITVPIADIAADKVASELFTRKPLPKGKTTQQFMAERIKKALPVLLKDHKKEVVTILSVLAGVSYDEYLENMTMASLIKDVVEMITDPIFAQLF